MTAERLQPDAGLQKVTERGRRSGFGNLLRKELGRWFATRVWWQHSLLWLVVMNGVIPLVNAVIKANPDAPLELIDQMVRGFFALGGTAAAVGVVLVGQDAVIGERQSGTAAWILSKPASRTAFILTKFLAHFFSCLILMVGLQSLIAYVQVGLWGKTWLDPLHFAAGVGILTLNQLFYISLTLMLGVLLHSRAAVLGVGLGWLFGGGLVLELAPALIKVLPIGMLDVAGFIAKGEPFAMFSVNHLVGAPLWSLLFLAIALWRFEREEL